MTLTATTQPFDRMAKVKVLNVPVKNVLLNGDRPSEPKVDVAKSM